VLYVHGPFTDRVHHRRKSTFIPLFPFVSFQIPIQRLCHQPKRHAIQLSHVVQRLRQYACNAALGILEPVIARQLVRHCRAQQRLNLLHHLLFNNSADFSSAEMDSKYSTLSWDNWLQSSSAPTSAWPIDNRRFWLR
jgi:hypothetical protein